MRRLGLQGTGVLRRLPTTTTNKIGAKRSSKIGKWTLQKFDDIQPIIEKPWQKLTYCNQQGVVKMLEHEMNDLDNAIDLTLSDEEETKPFTDYVSYDIIDINF